MIRVLVFFAALVAGASYYFLYHPPVVMKRATDKALMQFSEAVATKDRAKVGESLQALLTDDATIHLEVNFFSITGNPPPPMVQDFDKASFIRFIDNTLYPLTDYMYSPNLKKFALAGDKQSAAVTFTSKEWADGSNYYGGIAVNMRFSSDTTCEGKAVFSGKQARLQQATCSMQFRAVPKPQDLEKLQNMEGMRDYLSGKPSPPPAAPAP